MLDGCKINLIGLIYFIRNSMFYIAYLSMYNFTNEINFKNILTAARPLLVRLTLFT